MRKAEATAEVMAAGPPPRHWKLTADQYQRMGEAGILGEDDRVELLDGELYEMPPIGDWHNGKVDRLTWHLVPALRERAIVRVQGSFRLTPNSEPEPDLLLLRYRADFYEQGLPGPQDVLLLVEVADSSLAYDRDFKLPFYARAGIPAVWIVNRREQRIEVYREPAAGGYRVVTVVERGGILSPAAFPDLILQASEILG